MATPVPAPEAPKDPLTGVLSRATFQARLAQEVAAAGGEGYPLTLLMLDVDHFKSINDAFGYTTGDQVLVEVANRLQQGRRATDSVFRYGGDEFILLFPRTDEERAEAVAQRLLKGIASTPFPTQPPITVTASIGIAIFPQDADSPAALFEAADRRLHEAKRAGRDRLIAGVEQDAIGANTFRMEPPSRLLERDRAIETFQTLMKVLPLHRRGVLVVNGPDGSGKTRFLHETRQAARLLGYGVLALDGSPPLKFRQYGALDLARQGWETLPPPSEGIPGFVSALRQERNDLRQAGILITIDNLAEVDRASLEVVQTLLTAAGFPQVGLVYAGDGERGGDFLAMQELPLHETVTLEPISPGGLRIWVRQALQWEAPQEFLDWLYRETGGLPSLIQRGLLYLASQDILTAPSQGRVLRPGYETHDLAQQLAAIRETPRHNFPSSLPFFVGREIEMKQIQQLLRSNRLVTILGPGGLGKTRLAIQAAFESLDDYPDGVYFTPLAPVSQVDFLPTTIAEAVRCPLAGAQPPKNQLIQHLSTRRALLLLDNFEHLRDGAALLEEMLEKAPGIHILVTSRERLHLAAEIVFDLRSLPFPVDPAVQEIERYSAVQLFVNRARRAQNDFSLTEENRPPVARICRLVEGMPLGIEFAAVWVETFSCAEIAARIEENLAFLSIEDSEQPEHHRSLRAVFDSFWNLLSRHEQETVSRLAVFKGMFRQDAAASVAGVSAFFLDALAARSFVRKPQPGRFELHELLRQYAADRLHTMPEAQAAADEMHANFYARFVQQREARLGRERRVLEEIGAEFENVRAAWQWAISICRTGVLRLGLRGLASYCRLAGLLNEGEQAVRAAQQCLLSINPDLLTADDHSLVARLHQELAEFLNALGQLDPAIEMAQKAIKLAQRAQDPRTEAAAILQIGQSYWFQGRYPESAALSQKAIALAQSAAHPEIEASGLRLMGSVAIRQGDGAAARDYYQRALAASRAIGDIRGESACLNNLGNVYLEEGDYRKSQDYFLQALESLRGLSDRVREAQALNNLGTICDLMADYAGALSYCNQSLRIKREIGDRRGEGTTLGNLGFISMRLGDYASAREYMENARRISHDLGYRWNEALMYAYLGMLASLTDDPLGAIELAQAGLQMAEDHGDRSIQAYAHTVLGHTSAARGAWAEAAGHFETTITLRRELSQPHFVLDNQAGLAHVALSQGNSSEALAVVEEILRFLESQPTQEPNDLMRVYLTVYRVLEANGDPRARGVLSTAHGILSQRAARIPQGELRQAYLFNVKAHRELGEIWEAGQ